MCKSCRISCREASLETLFSKRYNAGGAKKEDEKRSESIITEEIRVDYKFSIAFRAKIYMLYIIHIIYCFSETRFFAYNSVATYLRFINSASQLINS